MTAFQARRAEKSSRVGSWRQNRELLSRQLGKPSRFGCSLSASRDPRLRLFRDQQAKSR